MFIRCVDVVLRVIRFIGGHGSVKVKLRLGGLKGFIQLNGTMILLYNKLLSPTIILHVTFPSAPMEFRDLNTGRIY